MPTPPGRPPPSRGPGASASRGWPRCHVAAAARPPGPGPWTRRRSPGSPAPPRRWSRSAPRRGCRQTPGWSAPPAARRSTAPPRRRPAARWLRRTASGTRGPVRARRGWRPAPAAMAAPAASSPAAPPAAGSQGGRRTPRRSPPSAPAPASASVPGRRRPRRNGALDRHPHGVAPLDPGAVVVADPLEAEELAQHEPGVAGALADAAVGDHVVTGVEAELALVQRAELVDALEGAVVVGRLLPGDIARPRDVATADRALLRVVGHVQQLARVLLGRADVHQRQAPADVRQHVVLEGPDAGIVTLDHRVARALALRLLADQRAALLDPLLPAAVQQADVRVPEEGGDPQCVRRPPVEVVPVEHYRVVAGDAPGGHHLGEMLAVHVVADDRVVQIGVPVDLDRTGNVACLVQQHVLVGLRHHHLRVVEVVGQPVRGDQPLRMCVAAQLVRHWLLGLLGLLLTKSHATDYSTASGGHGAPQRAQSVVTYVSRCQPRPVRTEDPQWAPARSLRPIPVSCGPATRIRASVGATCWQSPTASAGTWPARWPPRSRSPRSPSWTDASSRPRRRRVKRWSAPSWKATARSWKRPPGTPIPGAWAPPSPPSRWSATAGPSSPRSATAAPTSCGSGRGCARSPRTRRSSVSWSARGGSPRRRPPTTPSAAWSPAPSAWTPTWRSTRRRPWSWYPETSSCCVPTASRTPSTTPVSPRSSASAWTARPPARP